MDTGAVLKRAFHFMAPRFFSALVAGALFFAAASCSKEKPAAPPAPAPVKTSPALRKDMPVELTAVGEMQAYATVGVKSLVAGRILKVHFSEGQYVSKGDLLFTIDPKTFEAQLHQAEAALARDAAQLKNARVQAGRYEGLVKKGFVSQSDYDQFRTAADSLEATVKADEAAVENARVMLGYCYIHSPISGRAGAYLLDQGNVVKENADTPMVTIDRIQPIYASFSVPERNLHDIKERMARGPLKATVTVPDSPVRAEGRLSFVDNAVDSSTGTIALKASFQNSDRKLWPGQFVTVTLRLSILKDAVVVPTEAILTGQKGRYVFVVKKDSTAEMRPVVAGLTYGARTVVEKGVSPGETVVTDGQLQVVPGRKVAVKNASSPAE